MYDIKVMKKQELVNTYNQRFSEASPETVLEYFIKRIAGRIALASSLGLEDQVLTDMVCRIDPATRIFTLDTGMALPRSVSSYRPYQRPLQDKMELFFPDSGMVQEMVREDGLTFFTTVSKSANAVARFGRSNPSRGLSEGWTYGYADFA